MEDKKYYELTVNELLYKLEQKYTFDWVQDIVIAKIYNRHELDSSLIGKFYSVELMGEYILETVEIKSYSISYKESKRDTFKTVVISIVVDNKF